MPDAKLTVSVPDGSWMHEVSSTNPDTTFSVVSVLPGADTGVALVEFRSADVLALLAAVRDHDDVVDLELLWTRGDDALVEVETRQPRLLEPLLRAGVPLKTPFEIRDAAATWELTTSADRLSELGDRLADHGVEYDLAEVTSETDGDERVLTPRQREVLRAAVERGYYKVPRDLTLTELAGELGVAKASASDTLARAERRVVEWFAERKLAGATSPE